MFVLTFCVIFLFTITETLSFPSFKNIKDVRNTQKRKGRKSFRHNKALLKNTIAKLIVFLPSNQSKHERRTLIEHSIDSAAGIFVENQLTRHDAKSNSYPSFSDIYLADKNRHTIKCTH
jgi:hypothetical protein